MRHLFIGTLFASQALLAAATTTTAVTTPAATPTATQSAATSATTTISAKALKKICAACGIVESVTMEKRKGKGGAAGLLGGAVVGGLLGNQVGNGDGNTLATVGGAVGGAVLGNEIQKKVNTKNVWTTSVRMKDGTSQRFEQASDPGWKSGQVVHVKDGKLSAQP
jgi:outer membrane lipoprotein SlyB